MDRYFEDHVTNLTDACVQAGFDLAVDDTQATISAGNYNLTVEHDGSIDGLDTALIGGIRSEMNEGSMDTKTLTELFNTVFPETDAGALMEEISGKLGEILWDMSLDPASMEVQFTAEFTYDDDYTFTVSCEDEGSELGLTSLIDDSLTMGIEEELEKVNSLDFVQDLMDYMDGEEEDLNEYANILNGRLQVLSETIENVIQEHETSREGGVLDDIVKDSQKARDVKEAPEHGGKDHDSER